MIQNQEINKSNDGSHRESVRDLEAWSTDDVLVSRKINKIAREINPDDDPDEDSLDAFSKYGSHRNSVRDSEAWPTPGIPLGWKKCRDGLGCFFYKHAKTGKTQYNFPGTDREITKEFIMVRPSTVCAMVDSEALESEELEEDLVLGTWLPIATPLWGGIICYIVILAMRSDDGHDWWLCATNGYFHSLCGHILHITTCQDNPFDPLHYLQ